MTATTEWVLQEPPPNALTRTLRRRPWMAPTLVGVGLGLATAYTAWQDPNAGGVFPACPLKELTGWDCPGCGGLRAVHALTHGDVTAALDHNVFLAVVVPVLGVLWAVWFVRSLQATVALRRSARSDPDAATRPPPRRPATFAPSGRFWIAIGVVALAFAVVRNLDALPLFEYLGSDA